MKTRSLILFLLVASMILASAWGVFCGVSLGIERFAPMEVLQGGADMQGEASIFLRLQPEEGQQVTQEQIDTMIETLHRRLDMQGYGHSSVVQVGEDQFEIRVPINSTSEFKDVTQIAEVVATTGRVYIVDVFNDEEVMIDRDMIEGVELQTNSLGKFTIFLVMTDEGKAELAERTAEVANREREEDKNVRVYMDDTQMAELNVRQEATEGYFGFSSSYTEYEAERFANMINAGMLPVAVETVSLENASARMGATAWEDMLLGFGLVTASVMLILVMVFRVSGVMNALTILAYQAALVVVLALFGVRLDGAGLACLVIAFGYLIASLVYNNHAFKKQYESGKNLRAAYKSGYVEATSVVSNLGMILLVGFVALIASGSAVLESMAYAYGVALVLAYLCAMLINRMLFALMVRVQDDKAGLYFPLTKANEGGKA